MYEGQVVFSQVMHFLPLRAFHRCVARYKGQYKVHKFACLAQFYRAHLNSPAFSQINSPPASKEKKRGLRSSHEADMIITLTRITQDGRHFIRINTSSALRKLLI